MRLVASSDPDAVANAEDLRPLCERLALANAVCHALEESGERLTDETADSALRLLLAWVRQHFPSSEPETSAAAGLDDMRIPPDSDAIRQRLDAATRVCACLAWLHTADTFLEFEDDSTELIAALDWWRRLSARLIAAPFHPQYTRVQRLAMEYAQGASSVNELVDALIYVPKIADPKPWREGMEEWPGVVYMKSAGYLTSDQFVAIQEAYYPALLALLPTSDQLSEE
jgi:hypothetical protein